MPSRKKSPFRLVQASDRALLADFGGPLSEETDRKVAALARRLRGLPGLRAVQPAYTSVLVKFEANEVDREELARSILDLTCDESSAAREVTSREHVLPVCYEGALGPDLGEVAKLAGLSEHQIVELHSGVSYHVSFLGFLPGFAYLGGLPEALRVPRLPQARLRVPAGSIGIGDLQTGVYPLDSPGGWRLIGRTPRSVLDWTQDPPALFAPGDRVRFEPISRSEYERLGGRWET